MPDNSISAEEIEDAMALWQPTIDFMNKIKEVIHTAAPGMSDADVEQVAFACCKDITNEYLANFANSPSPW